MAEPAAESTYRYERKFYVDGLTMPEMTAVLRHHPAMFRPLYEPRHINNIYLDSTARNFYVDNVEGVADRSKTRIRWYGDLYGVHAATLELKIKRGFVGRKESYRLPAHEIRPGLSQVAVLGWLRQSGLPDQVRSNISSLRPALVNRYRRRYYLSADGRYRLTVDDDQQFRGFPGGDLSRVARRDRGGVIVELKYALGDDGDADRVSNAFPFRMTRSSKYVAGLERVEGL